MATKLMAQKIKSNKTETAEYNLLLDGVIELKAHTNAKEFFDGLLDAVIVYVERYDGQAGLTMSYETLDEDNGATENGGKGA